MSLSGAIASSSAGYRGPRRPSKPRVSISSDEKAAEELRKKRKQSQDSSAGAKDERRGSSKPSDERRSSKATDDRRGSTRSTKSLKSSCIVMVAIALIFVSWQPFIAPIG